mgnify:CR=1 FL=1
MLQVSERRACAAFGQHRSTQPKVPRGKDDEAQFWADIIELVRQYRPKVPDKQQKRGRLWLNEQSCMRLRAEHKNHVWAYDFVEDRTHEGRKYRTLNIVDEFTHECLAIKVNRRLNSLDVIDVLLDLFILRGIPDYNSSDNLLYAEVKRATRTDLLRAV